MQVYYYTCICCPDICIHSLTVCMHHESRAAWAQTHCNLRKHPQIKECYKSTGDKTEAEQAQHRFALWMHTSPLTRVRQNHCKKKSQTNLFQLELRNQRYNDGLYSAGFVIVECDFRSYVTGCCWLVIPRWWNSTFSSRSWRKSSSTLVMKPLESLL